MYTVVLSSGQISRSDISKSFQAFAALTSPECAQLSFQNANEIIDSYKKGEINTDAFLLSIKEIIDSNHGSPVSLDGIRDAWNAMSIISLEQIEELKNLEALQKLHNILIFVVGCTNQLHHDFEVKQLQDAGIELNYTKINSFQHNSLNVFELISSFHSELDIEGNNIFSFVAGLSLEFKSAELTCIQDTKRSISTVIGSLIEADLRVHAPSLTSSQGNNSAAALSADEVVLSIDSDTSTRQETGVEINKAARYELSNDDSSATTESKSGEPDKQGLKKLGI